MDTKTEVGWALRPATAADVEPIAELRAVVMRPDLVRLGRYDDIRVRQRFRDAFSPDHTWAITVAGDLAGCLTLRPSDAGGLLLEHFYLAPSLQGRGVGSAVLETVLGQADADGESVRLTVLQGSAARRLYERCGFTVNAEDPIDLHMSRPPRSVRRSS
jgi:GNAT superfamily N-acetyltransferase